MVEVGRVCEIVRYPVKSMAGHVTESAALGWHGLDGDRRFAFRRVGTSSGMPWLTASRLAELLMYVPGAFDQSTGEPLPTEVRSPSGSRLALGGEELLAELAERSGSRLALIKLDQGIFDEGAVSVISLATIEAIGREAGFELDRRRFRANILVETKDSDAFSEDGWVGGELLFGEGDPSPSIRVTHRDERCVMVNLDPETAARNAAVMKSIIRLNENHAGVYATVVRPGTIRVGDRVRFVSS